MEFIETHIFCERVCKLLSEEEYSQLQLELTRAPRKGALIPQGGGLRKLRWSHGTRGKRGGLRVIYYLEHHECCYMLFVYDKTQQQDLTREQLKMLRHSVKGEWS